MDFPLPENFNYKIIKKEKNKEYVFRIKEIANKDQAFKWLEKFVFSTKYTWRIARTYPNSSKNNIFKLDMRCTHSMNKRLAGLRSSKSTGCCATLQILIKRYMENILTEENKLNRDWPTIISIRGTHNHEFNTAEVLKYRDLSQSSLTKLKELFQKGHSASSALETLKTELLFEYGEKYNEIAADGYYVPSYSKVHKLFEKEFISEYGPFTDNSMVTTEEETINETDDSIHHSEASSHSSQSNVPIFSEEKKGKLNSLIKRMLTGIETAPEIYVPAAEKMLENADKYAKTDVGLVTAMHTFGTCNIAQAKNCAKKIIRRSHAVRIGAQPTAVGRRKKLIAGKKKLSAGREREVIKRSFHP